MRQHRTDSRTFQSLNLGSAVLGLLFAFLSSLPTALMFGQEDLTWLNTTNSNNAFGTATNWDFESVPTSADNAFFNQAFSYDVLFSTNQASNNLSISAGDVRFVGNGANYELQTDGMVNGADLTLSGTSMSVVNDLLVTSGNVMVDDGALNVAGATEVRSGSLTVSGIGSSWTSQSARFGSFDVGELRVENQASATINGTSYFGLSNNSSVTIDDATLNAGFVYTGFLGASNTTVLVRNGGTLNSEGGRLASFNNGTNASNVNATIDGATWNDTSELTIGDRGTATLNLVNGGVFNGGQVWLGRDVNSGGTGTLNVQGEGSSFNAASFLQVGELSAVNVSDQGAMNVSTLIVDGEVNVEGGTVNATGDTHLNNSGTINLTGGELRTWVFRDNAGGTFNHDGGALTIDNGTFVSDSNFIALGSTSGGTSTLNLINGSNVSRVGPIVIGTQGQAELNVESQSVLTVGLVSTGQSSNAVGTINVSGVGTSLVSNGSLTLGAVGNSTNPGQGILNVTDGATVSHLSDNRIGWGGIGAMNIESGGSVTNLDSSQGSLVAHSSSTSAVATVTGAGSTWNTGKYLTLGAGSANLTIADNGVVNVDGITTINDDADGFNRLRVNSGSLEISQMSAVATGLNTHELHVLGDHVEVTGATRIAADGRLRMAGGLLTTSNFEAETGSTFDFEEGTIGVGGGSFNTNTTDYTINGTTGLASLSLDFGATANYSGTLAVGPNGSLNLSSSEVNAESLVNSGTFFMSGASTINIDGGVFRPSELDYTIRSNTISSTPIIATVNLLNGGRTQYFSKLTVDQTGALNVLDGDVTLSNPFSLSDWNGVYASELVVTGSLNATGNLMLDPSTRLDINRPGLVSVGGQFSVAEGSTVDLLGRLEFGSTTYQELQSINFETGNNGEVGSVAGVVSMGPGGIVNVNEIDRLGGAFSVDASDVVWDNFGTILGTGSIDGALRNQIDSELRVTAGDRTRFATYDASHINSGRIDVVGSSTSVAEVEFEGNLVNDSDGLITARNALIRFDRGLENQGQFSIALGDAEIYGDINNNGGTFGLGGNSQVAVLGSLDQFGTMNLLEGSSLFVFDDFNGFGFEGTGSLEVLGTTSIGSSPGFASFGGDLTLGSDTLIEIGGIGDDQFDQFSVFGDMTLNGILSVEMWDNYLLTHNSEFLIANIYGNRNGMFAGLGEGDIVGNWNGVDLFISYAAGDGNDISFFTSVPEPANAGILMLVMAAMSTIRRRRVAKISIDDIPC